MALLVCGGAVAPASAQVVERELNASERTTISINNRNGRVIVTAVDGRSSVSLKATSPGEPVAESDVVSVNKGGSVQVDVRAP
jgi:hypothetical protein